MSRSFCRFASRCVRGYARVCRLRRGRVGCKPVRRKIGNNVRKEVASGKTVCLRDNVVELMYICVQFIPWRTLEENKRRE